MPELSVIMGVYNCPAKEMLVRAIDSILNQTYRDFEFIICDDGSTNDTLSWLKEKAPQDDRIVIIESEVNKGLANALNLCLKKATGTYIARQDIDDYSAPTRFETQLEFLREHPTIAFVGTACFVYDNNGLYGEWHRPEFPAKTDFLFNSPFIHGTVIFRKEVFETCGGYELIGRCRKYEDYAFFMHAYAEGFQGANIDQLLYTFFSEEKKNMVSTAMRFDEYSVRRKGFKELGLGIKRIPYILKPLVLILVPNKLLNSLKDN
ncbi:MAG: glycosyltransferase, partial [Lachnospiraceae bacterium]|nr:glycosyltransferase [Lachnospiraceae bacterium]